MTETAETNDSDTLNSKTHVLISNPLDINRTHAVGSWNAFFCVFFFFLKEILFCVAKVLKVCILHGCSLAKVSGYTFQLDVAHSPRCCGAPIRIPGDTIKIIPGMVFFVVFF